MSKTYGYARESTNDPKQTPNLKEQVRLLEELAQHETYAEAPWETCVCERRSASDCLWDKRPDFMRLWHCLEPGDFLLVWRLDRIERTLHAGNRFLAAAHDKNVNVHEISHPYDLNDTNDSLIATFKFFTSETWVKQHSQAAKQGIARARREGKPIGPRPGLGKKFICDDQGVYREVWEHRICAAIREITRRFRRGESLRVICFDLEARRIPAALGRLVAVRNGEGKRVGTKLMQHEPMWWGKKRKHPQARIIKYGYGEARQFRHSYERLRQAMAMVEQMEADGTYQNWCRETGGDSTCP